MLYDLVGTIDPWKKHPRRGLAEKKLLIIGTGNIGGRIYNYMKPLMDVMKFDIIDNELSELTSMIKEADCITLHIPKTSDNVSFISKDKLTLMKKGAILVNTARGSLVDEDALYNELESGRIKAAFDVFWEEPYNGKLKKLHSNQFFMTPHVASTCNGFLIGCRESLDILIQELDKRGYVNYEFSSFAKPGYNSINNSNYWNGKAYIGIGPSAHSYNGKSIR